jgi:biopolymer transport protein TolR
MPGVAGGSVRGSRRGRRAMNEINMVPFIDVMLVLLIIFMVTAPLITTGVVDLPSVGKSQQRPASVIEVIVGTDERLRLRVDGKEPAAVTLAALPARVRELQGGNAMDSLQRAGVRRVGLSVKQGAP